MPSGAKRRKAAKKKKEQEANVNSSTNDAHGNDGSKSQDERDSDGGDVSSITSQDDHNHQHTFNQGKEGKGAPSPDQSQEGKGAPSLDQSHVTKNKSLEEDIVSRDVNVQHGKSSSSSSNSSTSSSDDDSQDSLKKSKEEASHLHSEATSYSNEDKSAAVKFEEDVQFTENETPVNVVSYSVVETAAVKSEDYVKFAENETSVNVVSHSVMETSAVETPNKTMLPVSEEENEGKIIPSTDSVAAESSNVVGKTQDSETPDYSEKQPLVSSTQPVMQRTSVFSCCGLLDLFSGSGR